MIKKIIFSLIFIFLLSGSLIFLTFTLLKKEINIIYAFDESYAPYATASMASILDNAKFLDDIHFYLILFGVSGATHQNLKELQSIKKHKISFVDLRSENFPTIPRSMINSVSIRMFLTDVFPTLDKALYIDADTIITSSLSDFYTLPLLNTYGAVISDTKWSIDYRVNELGLSKYFNAGVMLLNLKKIRAENLPEQFLQAHRTLYAEDKIIWEDQDIMNYVFKENLIFLPQRFNLLAHDSNNFSETETKNPQIIHYTSCKPWRETNCNFTTYYLKYKSKTSYKNKIEKNSEP